MECTHDKDHVLCRDKNKKFYLRCSGCGLYMELPEVKYDTNKFRTTVSPTMHDYKIFNVTILEDGSYIYERKKVEG